MIVTKDEKRPCFGYKTSNRTCAPAYMANRHSSRGRPEFVCRRASTHHADFNDVSWNAVDLSWNSFTTMKLFQRQLFCDIDSYCMFSCSLTTFELFARPDADDILDAARYTFRSLAKRSIFRVKSNCPRQLPLCIQHLF